MILKNHKRKAFKRKICVNESAFVGNKTKSEIFAEFTYQTDDKNSENIDKREEGKLNKCNRRIFNIKSTYFFQIF